MFETIKNSLGTLSGWVAIVQMVAKGIEYFLPASEDTLIDAISTPACALVIAIGALYHFVTAGTPTETTTTSR
jgi:hypothetical protein